MTVDVTPLLLQRNADGTYSIDVGAVGGLSWQTLVGSARYIKDIAGIVHLTGLVHVNATGIFATLPAGYRPDPQNGSHACVFQTDTGVFWALPVGVDSATGAVAVAAVPEPGNVHLDSVHFKAA